MKLKRIIKYQSLSNELKKLFKMTYQDGFESFLIQFTDPRDGRSYPAVALDAEDSYYLVNVETLMQKSFQQDALADIEDEDMGSSAEDDDTSFDADDFSSSDMDDDGDDD